MPENRFSRMRRIICPGYPYFITNVTDARKPILIENINLIWEAFDSTKRKSSFELIAWVFLPEHFHIMVNPDKGDISKLMQRLKLSFSMNFRKRCGFIKGPVWQNRFWDHVIRDDEDYARHLDYIHINPVKHGLAGSPFDWPHSSIHKFKEYYPSDWGCRDKIVFDGEFGE